MPDQSMTVFWLLAGGLVVVSAALGKLAVAYVRLRREMARRDGPNRRTIPKISSPPSGGSAAETLTRDAIAAVFRAEFSAFQAAYRAEIELIRAEIRTGDALNAVPEAVQVPQSAQDRLDHAIALARAGAQADAIMRECDLDQADAEALVRFHGPRRAAEKSPQR